MIKHTAERLIWTLRVKGARETTRLVLLNLVYPFRHLTREGAEVRRKGLAFDQAWGTDTAGLVEVSQMQLSGNARKTAQRYEPTGEEYFRTIIRELAIDPAEYSFIDLGSGKGRTLMLAATYPFRKVVGVELDKSLHETAQKNMNIYRRRASTLACEQIETFNADATEAALPDGPLFIYMYNPFGGPVMETVCDRVRESLRDSDRKVVVVYANALWPEAWTRAEFLEEVPGEDDWRAWKHEPLAA